MNSGDNPIATLVRTFGLMSLFAVGGANAAIPEMHRNTGLGMMYAGVEYLDHLRGYRNQSTYLGRTLLRDEPLKSRLIPMIKELVAA